METKFKEKEKLSMRTRLRAGEKVLYLARRHWITIATYVVPVVLAIVLTVYARYHNPAFENIAVGLLVLSLALFVYKVLERKFDIWVVTNYRIIDEWGVFSHNFKESPVEKINNVTVKQSLIGRIFNYGNVEIQTAAEAGNTVINGAESPKALQEVILSVIHEKQNAPGQTEDTKECPVCAEIIKKKARICRFCGYKFEETETEKGSNTSSGTF